MINVLEVKWLDRPIKSLTDIRINHSIEGFDIKLMMYMIEMQLAEGREDVVINVYDTSGMCGYDSIIYHMSPEQARMYWQSLDGFHNHDRVEFVTHATFWSEWLTYSEHNLIDLPFKQIESCGKEK